MIMEGERELAVWTCELPDGQLYDLSDPPHRNRCTKIAEYSAALLRKDCTNGRGTYDNFMA